MFFYTIAELRIIIVVVVVVVIPQYLTVVVVNDCFKILGATISNFYCVPVENFVEFVFFREVLVYKC